MKNSIEIREEIIQKELEKNDLALAVVTATKPDFYKQASVVKAAEKIGLPCFLINTGQHYDDLLGHGLKEYGVSNKIGVELGIRGGLSQKASEMISKTKKVVNFFEEKYEDKFIIPLVHGDTLAAGIFPEGWMLASNQKCAHNEAGLRGMMPQYDNYKDIETFIDNQFNEEWTLDRSEPFPEQYDTFIGSAACEYHFAPTPLNKKNLTTVSALLKFSSSRSATSCRTLSPV